MLMLTQTQTLVVPPYFTAVSLRCTALVASVVVVEPTQA